MDEKLQRALDASNFRLNLLNLKENIALKVETLSIYAINGGIFKINRELITFTKLIMDSERTSVVLIDENNNPIEITNISVFYQAILDRYFQATNFYHTEYTKLKKMRSSNDMLSDLKADA
jgi:hypothetical protein